MREPLIHSMFSKEYWFKTVVVLSEVIKVVDISFSSRQCPNQNGKMCQISVFWPAWPQMQRLPAPCEGRPRENSSWGMTWISRAECDTHGSLALTPSYVVFYLNGLQIRKPIQARTLIGGKHSPRICAKDLIFLCHKLLPRSKALQGKPIISVFGTQLVHM